MPALRVSALRLLAVTVASGLPAGFALDVLTWLVARDGPQATDGQPWSFRGNGALVVPFGLGSALLAGVWTALVLHSRSAVRWRSCGLAPGLIGGLFVLTSIGVLPCSAPRPSGYATA